MDDMSACVLGRSEEPRSRTNLASLSDEDDDPLSAKSLSDARARARVRACVRVCAASDDEEVVPSAAGLRGEEKNRDAGQALLTGIKQLFKLTLCPVLSPGCGWRR